jgi:hypothetical protein
MEIIVSYRDTASAAVEEFLTRPAVRGSRIGRHSPFVGPLADDWSPMLPGLVCDLRPEVAGNKFPAIFLAFLTDELLISCKLKPSSGPTEEQEMASETRVRNNALGNLRRWVDTGRNVLIFKIAEGSISVRRVMRDAPVLNPYAQEIKARAAHAQNAPAVSILQLAAELGESEAPKDRLASLLTLLLDNSADESQRAILRRLTREYDCKFAWSSIRLDAISQVQTLLEEIGTGASGRLSRRKVLNANFQPGAAQSFSENSGLFMWPSSLLYSPSFERGAQGFGRLLPSWRRFIIFVTNAARHTNIKHRGSKIHTMLKGRRKVGLKKAPPHGNNGGGQQREAGPLKTLMHLFRGSGAPLPVEHIRQRRASRASGGKALLLKIERALNIPNTNTILSLYRGDTYPVRAASRKPREKR